MLKQGNPVGAEAVSLHTQACRLTIVQSLSIYGYCSAHMCRHWPCADIVAVTAACSRPDLHQCTGAVPTCIFRLNGCPSPRCVAVTCRVVPVQEADAAPFFIAPFLAAPGLLPSR
jgi:hypothetical protein